MTFWTYVTFAGCGAAECFLTGQTARHAPLKQYALVSITAMAGTYITNMALKYVNYSTRIVFKSSRSVGRAHVAAPGCHYHPHRVLHCGCEAHGASAPLQAAGGCQEPAGQPAPARSSTPAHHLQALAQHSLAP